MNLVISICNQPQHGAMPTHAIKGHCATKWSAVIETHVRPWCESRGNQLKNKSYQALHNTSTQSKSGAGIRVRAATTARNQIAAKHCTIQTPKHPSTQAPKSGQSMPEGTCRAACTSVVRHHLVRGRIEVVVGIAIAAFGRRDDAWEMHTEPESWHMAHST